MSWLSFVSGLILGILLQLLECVPVSESSHCCTFIQTHRYAYTAIECRQRTVLQQLSVLPMSWAIPRLPSGIYYSLLEEAHANQDNHVPEDTNFQGYSRLRDEIWDESNTSPSRKTPSNPVVDYRGVSKYRRDWLPLEPQPRTESSGSPSTPTELRLPPIAVKVDSKVDCSIAETNVIQTFANNGDLIITEAWYSFPLYDGAAVTKFRCEVGDEKVLEGRVKPKQEARHEFQHAVKKLEAAALVEEMTPEVFQTTLGNIHPGVTVKVEITYVEELHADLSGEGIILTIPTSVAPRYGVSPKGYDVNTADEGIELALTVSIAFPEGIGAIDCRSGHSLSVKYGEMSDVPEVSSFEKLKDLQGQAATKNDSRYATVRLSDTRMFMIKDFILFIESPGKMLLKSGALLAPASDSGYAAMRVTVRPSELFSDLHESMEDFDGEILFLADRSGSMAGPKMKALKDALLLFLKSLPEKCKFNLYSFGSRVLSLWPCSAPYGQSTLEEAMQHLSSFEANLGGTEVLEALEQAAGDRRSTGASSTQIIILTDGEIWQPERTIDFVRKTASKAVGHVRFFILGIGNQVNHQLVRGIGFFGCGIGETVAVDAESKWQAAVIRMLQGAIMPESWSYSIRFVDFDHCTERRLDVDDFSPQYSKTPISQALHSMIGNADFTYVQAPRDIPILHHFGQQSVYFLLDTTSDEIPQQISITARSQQGRTKEATLDVERITFTNNIHHLAAKAAIRDLEMQHISESATADYVRSNAERLCQMYSIISKWASFVAVAHVQQSAEYAEVEVSLYKAQLAELNVLMRPNLSKASLSSVQGPGHAHPGGAHTLMARYHSSGQKRKRSETCSLRDFLSHQRVKDFMPSGESARKRCADPPAVGMSPGFQSSNPLANNHCPIIWLDIVRAQLAGGLFCLNKNLRHRMAQHFCHDTPGALERWVDRHLKKPVDAEPVYSKMTALLVDTVMSLTYIRSHLYSQRALWDLVVQKAESKLASKLDASHQASKAELWAIADLSLAHAHYGRYLKAIDDNSGRGEGQFDDYRGVCAAEHENWPPSEPGDDGLMKCSTIGCHVAVREWDDFWAHVTEQGHIDSSCGAARSRYEEAEAKLGLASEDGGDRKREDSP